MKKYKKLLTLFLAVITVSYGLPSDSFANPTSWVEKTKEYRMSDGVGIRVHYTEKMLIEYGAAADFGQQVLDAAVNAYQTITDFEGFNTPGFSLADPDRDYAYDPDTTVDVYLGFPTGENYYAELGARNRMFKDAPCFDILQLSATQYQAVILLPANYRDFIKSWEKINPSPLGKRNLQVDLRGTLIHEMLHVIVFFYNKNLNKSGDAERSAESPSPESAAKNLDWYVEGLARYFETFAGARHDFYSQGFKQMLPDKVRFSRGGSNYFMRYPDQPFTRLRYENALFWRFMDHRYGMASIEALSREFRKNGGDFKGSLETITGEPFEALLTSFALSVLQKDFGLKDDSAFLNEIAQTRLRYRDHAFYLLDGLGNERFLGKKCDTDWIGRWERTQAGFESASVAGDSTEAADVSGWATDFYEITLDEGRPTLPKFRVHHGGDGAPFYLQLICLSKGGSSLYQSWGPLAPHRSQTIDVSGIVRQNGLKPADMDRLQLLITNTDPTQSAPYELILEE